MNFMDEKDLKPEKKTEESEDGYSFMNETVKPPPPDVGKLRKTRPDRRSHFQADLRNR